MARYRLDETPIVVGLFNTGDTVTVTVYNKLTGGAVALNSNACIEIASTGMFEFNFGNITTAPTIFTQYVWVMTNSGVIQRDEVEWGGWTEDIGTPPLVGANVVTVTIEDALNVPLLDVQVSVWNAGLTTLLDSKTTDLAGITTFAMDDDDYKVVLKKNQVSFTVPEDLTVSGTTAQTYTGNLLTITPPVDVGVCRVYGFSYNQASTSPTATFDGTAKITSLPYNSNDKYHVGDKIKGIFDVPTGHFYWDIVQGASVLFDVKQLGISKQSQVSFNATTAKLSDLVAI